MSGILILTKQLQVFLPPVYVSVPSSMHKNYYKFKKITGV